jgi:hypothetical protein
MGIKTHGCCRTLHGRKEVRMDWSHHHRDLAHLRHSNECARHHRHASRHGRERCGRGRRGRGGGLGQGSGSLASDVPVISHCRHRELGHRAGQGAVLHGQRADLGDCQVEQGRGCRVRSHHRLHQGRHRRAQEGPDHRPRLLAVVGGLGLRRQDAPRADWRDAWPRALQLPAE